MRQGYTRLTVTDAGSGATELWWTADATLGTSTIQGTVLAAFDRTTYVEFDDDVLTAGALPPILALGRSDLRMGPLLTRVERTDPFSFRRLGLDRGCDCRLTRASTGALCLTVDGRLTVALKPGECLDPLPINEHRQCGMRPQRFQPGTACREQQRSLLSWLDRETTDGLFWLARLSTHLDGDRQPAVAALGKTIVEVLQGDYTDAKKLKPLVDYLGRGPGATPAGDDLLSGILLVLMRLTDARQRRRAIALGKQLVEVAHERTNKISVAFLAQAARGRAAAPTLSYLRAAVDGPDRCSEAAFRERAKRVLSVGNTSGSDTLAGMLTAMLIVLPALAPKNE